MQYLKGSGFKVKSEFKKKEILFKTERGSTRSARGDRAPVFAQIKNLFYILLILAFVYFFVFSSIFKIKDIDAISIESPEIYDRIALDLLGKNIIFFRVGDYLKKITSDFPIIEEIRIVRGLPSTLRIEVKERDTMLLWCAQKCFEIDNRGVAYKEAERGGEQIVLFDKSGIEIRIGDRLASKRFIDFYFKATSDLDQNGIKISEAYIEDTTFKLVLKTSEGWSIILDTSASLDNQIFALKQILENNRSDISDYVDLRVEGVGYLK